MPTGTKREVRSRSFILLVFIQHLLSVRSFGAGDVCGDQDSQGPFPQEGDILVRQAINRQIKREFQGGLSATKKAS